MTMTALIKSHVDNLFADAERLRPRGLKNPVTGDYWLANVVPDDPEKRNACRALLAREWFALYGPPDAPQLPISDVEIEILAGCGDFAAAVAHFAASLKANDWDFTRHPGFGEFVGGLLSLPRSGFTEPHIIGRRFHPKPLAGLWPTRIWGPVH
jgi:hypothetical protein